MYSHFWSLREQLGRFAFLLFCYRSLILYRMVVNFDYPQGDMVISIRGYTLARGSFLSYVELTFRKYLTGHCSLRQSSLRLNYSTDASTILPSHTTRNPFSLRALQISKTSKSIPQGYSTISIRVPPSAL